MERGYTRYIVVLYLYVIPISSVVGAIVVSAVAQIENVELRLTLEDFANLGRLLYHVIAGIAIIIGGAWALFRMKIFSETSPSLTLELEIQDRMLSNGKRYVLVLSKLINTSRVAVDFGKSECILHDVHEFSEERVVEYQSEIRGKTEGAIFDWPTIDEDNSNRKRELEIGSCIIEPQAIEEQFYEFIIDNKEPVWILVKCLVYDRQKQIGNAWSSLKLHQLGKGEYDGEQERLLQKTY